jgi:hypothetical protein
MEGRYIGNDVVRRSHQQNGARIAGKCLKACGQNRWRRIFAFRLYQNWPWLKTYTVQLFAHDEPKLRIRHGHMGCKRYLFGGCQTQCTLLK